MAEGAFEAKVSGKRESSAGIFITLQVQPDDFTADLAVLRVGAALQVAWAEIVDTSIQPIEVAASSNGKTSGFEPENSRSNRDAATKPKRKFHELSLAEQAGIRCEDEQFCKFIESKARAMMTRVGVVDYVRKFCGVSSRGEIVKETNAAVRWVTLNGQFEAWQLDQKYADVRR